MPLALGFGFSRPEHVRAVAVAEHGQSPGLLDEVERYVRWLKS
jgi:hypothetical protein